MGHDLAAVQLLGVSGDDAGTETESRNGPYVMALRSHLSRVPAVTIGLSLGLSGLAGVWCMVEKLEPSWGTCSTAAYLPWSLSLALFLLWTLRVLWCVPVCLDELHLPATCSAYGPASILVSIYAANLLRTEWHINGYAPLVIVIGAAVVQAVLMLYFFVICWRHQVLPEPFYFPVVVSISTISLIGNKAYPSLHGPVAGPIVLLFFWLGIICTVLLVPICAFRVLKYPGAVAPSPSAALLMAPCSFMLVTYYTIKEDIAAEQLGKALPSVLFVASSALCALTWIAIFQRRKLILAQGFTPAYAAFTYPSASTAEGAVLFATETAGHHPIAIGYAWMQVIALTALVLGISVVFIWHLPQWCRPDKDCQAAVRRQTHNAALAARYRRESTVASKARSSTVTEQSAIQNILLGALVYGEDGEMRREVGVSYGHESAVPNRQSDGMLSDALLSTLPGLDSGGDDREGMCMSSTAPL